jgi:hypothetical protein
MGCIEISIYFKKYSQKNSEFVFDQLFKSCTIGFEQKNKNTDEWEVIKIHSKEKIKELKKLFLEGKHLNLALYASCNKEVCNDEAALSFSISVDLSEKYKGHIYIQFNASFAVEYTIEGIHLYDYLKKNFITPIKEHCEIDELMFNDTKIV